MQTPTKRRARSIDYLLSVLSPLEVARSTRRYLEELSPQERGLLIARATARLDDDERAFLQITPDFATFLEQNRRALHTLDPDALRAILLPVIAAEPGDELVATLRAALPQPPPMHALRRLAEPLREHAVVAARGASAVATALVVVASGVAAAGLLTVIVHSLPPQQHAAPPPAPSIAFARPEHGVPAHVVKALSPNRPAHIVRVARATPAPTPRPTPAPTATARPTIAPATPRPAAVRRVAVKQPPHRHTEARRARVQTVATAVDLGDASIRSHEPQLVARARLIVMSYLDSLMRGDASAALGNLGLSASAGTSNLTEAPILAGATEFRIVDARLADAQNANVHVVIDSPQGRYFGNYVVSANGPAVWITQHQLTSSGSDGH